MWPEEAEWALRRLRRVRRVIKCDWSVGSNEAERVAKKAGG